MKSVLKSLFLFMTVLCGIWAVIHRRVIMAYVKGEELPEAPAWHKSVFCHKD